MVREQGCKAVGVVIRMSKRREDPSRTEGTISFRLESSLSQETIYHKVRGVSPPPYSRRKVGGVGIFGREKYKMTPLAAPCVYVAWGLRVCWPLRLSPGKQRSKQAINQARSWC